MTVPRIFIHCIHEGIRAMVRKLPKASLSDFMKLHDADVYCFQVCLSSTFLPIVLPSTLFPSLLSPPFVLPFLPSSLLSSDILNRRPNSPQINLSPPCTSLKAMNLFGHFLLAKKYPKTSQKGKQKERGEERREEGGGGRKEERGRSTFNDAV